MFFVLGKRVTLINSFSNWLWQSTIVIKQKYVLETTFSTENSQLFVNENNTKKVVIFSLEYQQFSAACGKLSLCNVWQYIFPAVLRRLNKSFVQIDGLAFIYQPIQNNSLV